MHEFQKEQLEFVRQLKAGSPIDPIKKNKVGELEVYRSLLYNNYFGLISPCFPVTRQIIKEETFRHLTDLFFQEGQSFSPHFHELATAFLAFYRKRQESLPYPFTYELMHYEWLEMHLLCLPEQEASSKELSVDLLSTRPFRFSKLSHLEVYQYPVDRMGKNFLPEKPSPTIMLLHRNNLNRVAFIKLKSLTYRLLLSVTKTEPVVSAISSLFKELSAEEKKVYNSLDSFMEASVTTLASFHQKHILHI